MTFNMKGVFMNVFRWVVLLILVFEYHILLKASPIPSEDFNIFTKDSSQNCSWSWLFASNNKDKCAKKWTPFPAYNNNDGWMLGFAIINDNQDAQLSYLIAPMYSFRQSKICGQAWLKYNLYGSASKFQKLTLGIGVKSFDLSRNEKLDYSLRYIRIDPKIVYHFKHNEAHTTTTNLSLTTFFIAEDEATFNMASFLGLKTVYHFIPRMEYSYKRVDDYQGTDLKMSMEHQSYDAESYLKLTSIAEQKYKYTDKKHLYFRGFLSGFIWNTQRKSTSYQNIFTRGSIALIHQGFNDYTYDETFLSRQNQSGFQNDQISTMAGGGFKTPVGSAYNIGMSNHFAASLGFSADMPFRLPKWIPLRAYFDIGTYSTYANDKFNKNIIYNGGFSLHYRDIATIYFPLVFSENIGNIYKTEHRSFLSKISFSLQLNKLAPGKLPSNLY